MKKILTFALCAGLSVASASAASFPTVLEWMSSNGLTKYTTEASYRPSDSITRGEIAKFFVQYAKYKNLVKGSAACVFTDISSYDETLVPYIQEVCEYGLMKGSKGAFRPNETLTQAEAVTVISRTLLGLQNENGNPRWTEYYNIATTYKIISVKDVWALQAGATRGVVGTRLYNASSVSAEQVQEEGTDDVLGILEEIFEMKLSDIQ